jgi:glucose/arabinose dehydrogenase
MRIRSVALVLTPLTLLASLSQAAEAASAGIRAGAIVRTSEAARTRPADARRSRATIHRRAVKTGLNQAVTFTFTPAGKIFFGEKGTGAIRILDPATKHQHLFFTVSNVVSDGERGLLGLALHPDYPSKPVVFAYATRLVSGQTRNQILRIRNDAGHGRDPRVIFSSKTTAGSYHDGGRILFGPDGFLYAMQGEAHDSSNAQDKSNTAGKILRMTQLGKAAPGNPFSSRIWTYGHRNSFGMAFDPVTGKLWETENGPSCNDELNRIVKGGNFGWGPNETCSGTAPQDTNNSGPNPILPKRWYTPTIAPTGIVFCHNCKLGQASGGKLFFGAYNNGQIRRVTLTSNRLGVKSQTVVFTNPDGIYSMETGPSRCLYFSDSSGIFRLVFN